MGKPLGSPHHRKSPIPKHLPEMPLSRNEEIDNLKDNEDAASVKTAIQGIGSIMQSPSDHLAKRGSIIIEESMKNYQQHIK